MLWNKISHKGQRREWSYVDKKRLATDVKMWKNAEVGKPGIRHIGGNYGPVLAMVDVYEFKTNLVLKVKGCFFFLMES